MSASARVYPVLALLSVGLWSAGAACTTFSGISDVGEGGAGQGGAGQVGSGTPTGTGSGKGSATAAGSGGATGGTPASSTTGAGNGSSTAASSTGASGPGPASASSSAAASSSASGGGNDPTQLCVDTINMYRATLGLPPYARWNAEESCAGTQAMKDYQAMTAHSAFGQCSENAQDECPGWPAPESTMITGCLAQMWAEGPGPFNGHGHYINMSSMSYTKVACGFYTTPQGSIWATQDFQ